MLTAGANPNDGESVYHSTEHADLECLRLLLDRGASLLRTNALKHVLDREDAEGLRLLLAAGADPNETNGRGETALHWAVWRGRGAGIVAMLLDSGVAVDTLRADGRTAYAVAVQKGQLEIAALLEARGANTKVSKLDRFLGACVGADSIEMDRLLKEASQIIRWPGTEGFIPDLAMSHSTAAIRALLAAGLPVDARGEMGGTGLHWACWKGYADLVQLLIDHGASLTVEDSQFHGTPPGWFAHGLHNCGDGGGEYAEVARLLLSAGANIPACDVPTGNAEVDAVLREHGLNK